MADVFHWPRVNDVFMNCVPHLHYHVPSRPAMTLECAELQRAHTNATATAQWTHSYSIVERLKSQETDQAGKNVVQRRCHCTYRVRWELRTKYRPRSRPYSLISEAGPNWAT